MNILKNINGYDILAILITLIIYLSFLYFKDKKHTKDIKDYLVMGRVLTLPLFVITLVSTWYGSILGTTQIAFENGIYNFVTQGLFWYISAAIFAIFFVSRARSTQAISFSELFTKVFGESTGKLTAIILFIKILPIPYAISMGYIIQTLTGLSLNLSIVLGTIIVTLYCLRGGIKNIILTDIFQFFLIYSCLIIVVVLSYIKFGGPEYLTAKLPNTYFQINGENKDSKVIAWFVIAISTTLLSPIFYQRCFAANSDKTAKVGIFISMMFWFISDIFTTNVGLYAKAYFGEIHHINAFIDYSLIILPSPLKGFFLISIFITAFSVLDSHLFLASSTLGYDLFKKKYSISKNFRNLILLITSFFTIIISFYFEGKIENAWYIIESIFLATLLFPLITAMFFPKTFSSKTINLSIIMTLFFVLVWQILGFDNHVETLLVGLIFSLSCLSFLKITNFLK